MNLPVADLLRAVLANAPDAHEAGSALAECGIRVGNVDDFVSPWEYRANSPCVAVCIGTAARELRCGPAWEGKTPAEIGELLLLIPKSIPSHDPHTDEQPPLALIAEQSMWTLAGERVGILQVLAPRNAATS